MKTKNSETAQPGSNSENAQSAQDKHLLKLYIAGSTPQSQKAIHNIKTICEEHLHDIYTLEVIDLYENPALAKGEQIIAVPTLIKQLPLPLRRIIGDMSSTEKILVGLDIKPLAQK